MKVGYFRMFDDVKDFKAWVSSIEFEGSSIAVVDEGKAEPDVKVKPRKKMTSHTRWTASMVKKLRKLYAENAFTGETIPSLIPKYFKGLSSSAVFAAAKKHKITNRNGRQ